MGMYAETTNTDLEFVLNHIKSDVCQSNRDVQKAAAVLRGVWFDSPHTYEAMINFLSEL